MPSSSELANSDMSRTDEGVSMINYCEARIIGIFFCSCWLALALDKVTSTVDGKPGQLEQEEDYEESFREQSRVFIRLRRQRVNSNAQGSTFKLATDLIKFTVDACRFVKVLRSYRSALSMTVIAYGFRAARVILLLKREHVNDCGNVWLDCQRTPSRHLG